LLILSIQNKLNKIDKPDMSAGDTYNWKSYAKSDF